MHSGVGGTLTPVAIFEVSSASAAGAHVFVPTNNHEGPSTILAQSRVFSPFSSRLDITRYLEQAVQNLSRVVDIVRAADDHHPDTVQLVLAAPWYQSQTRAITYNKSTPFTCTEQLVEQLIQKEIEHIIEHEKETFGAIGVDYTIVEKQLSSIKLNGYTTHKPYGKKAVSLEIYISITVVPKVVIDRLSTVLARTYGSRKINVTTAMHAAFIAIRDNINTTNECTIIDIGEELTDVTFIKDNILLYQHSFPVGIYELYRTLGEQGGHTSEEAAALLELHRTGKSGTIAGQIDKAIASFTTQWQSELQKILDGGDFGFCLPEHCYISVDTRFELLFSASINNDPFVQHMCSRGIVRAVPINQALIEPSVKMIDAQSPDVALAIATMFTNRLLSS